MRSRFVSLVLFLSAAVATAQPLRDRERPAIPAPDSVSKRVRACATGPELDRDVEKLHRFVQQRQRGRLMALSAPSVRIDKGAYIMATDSSVAPFDRPFDLEGSSLVFTRTSATGFSVQKTALNYDSTVGTLTSTMSGLQTVPYHLSSFSFPFYSSNVTDFVLSSTKGIFLNTPPTSRVYQLGGLEALSQRVPVIAPLLEPTNPPPYDAPDGSYYLYVKESATSLTITWRYRYVGGDDVQVVLYSNGNIQMSYRTIGSNLPYGTAIVTSGNESWYGSTTPLGSFTDPSGDVSPTVPAALKDMLDVTSVAVRRVSNSDLVEFAVTMNGPINRAAIPAGDYLVFDILPGSTSAEQSANEIYARIGATITRYSPGGWYYTQDSPAIAISGNTITFRILDEDMAFASSSITVKANTWLASSASYADQSQGNITMAAAGSQSQTDFSQLASAVAIDGKPIVEAFTLPSIDLFQIWSVLQSRYGLTDTNVDQLAVYQTFNTDLDFYAGAYSTNSNPQVDNIASSQARYQYGTAYPKRASLLHLDKLGYGWNRTADGRLSVISHEFGHRWLYAFTIREGSADTFSLNPDRAHPKQGVHIPAAFTWKSSTDSSTMGGGYFTQTGTLTYQTPPQIGYYGYSWHELYLMGLASTAEITQPWFYLNGPGLESAYYPMANHTYDVTARTDVNFGQITTSMGFRNPDSTTSQKTFTMAFVILERAATPVSSTAAAAFAADYPVSFRPYFATITGSRGSVKIAPDSMPPEANFSYSPATPTVGNPVSFTDLSYGEPTAWSWSFGDFTKATTQNPSHTYASAGVYSVTLTAFKAIGSSNISKSVTVFGPPTNVLATATAPQSVTITWDAVAGGTYEVQRIGAGPTTTTVLGTTSSGQWIDATALAGAAYLYKVRLTAPTTSAFGGPDLATTVIFTDPTLTAGTTPIRAAHINELRIAVNAVRTLAGQLPAVFTDSTLTAGMIAKSLHLTELRNALDEARATLVLTPLTYANSAAANTIIRAADVTELRNGVK